jgi:hypothetical protein
VVDSGEGVFCLPSSGVHRPSHDGSDGGHSKRQAGQLGEGLRLVYVFTEMCSDGVRWLCVFCQALPLARVTVFVWVRL